MRSKITKAIIPAAGLGTRFLPATKSIPKEMLTLVDSPAILYVVEEAVMAGIEDIILIQGRGKVAIEDFFDVSYELEDKLAKDGKIDILERLNRIKNMANIISIRQKQPLGLGHAVLCSKPVMGDEPFAVLLGDEVLIPESGQPNVTRQLVNNFNQTQLSTIAVMEVADSEVSKYGIANLVELPSEDSLRKVNYARISESDDVQLSEVAFEVKGLIEKPHPSEVTSRWALPGRYSFSSEIFNYLQQAKPGKNGEIQLTDAMAHMLKEFRMLAIPAKSKRYDTGNPLGFLKANVELSIMHPQIGPEVKLFIKEIYHQILESENKVGK